MTDTLTALVAELANAHDRTVTNTEGDEITGPEEPLLLLLHRAVRTKSNDPGEGGRGGDDTAKSALNFKALGLWDDIAGTISAESGAPRDWAAAGKLRRWAHSIRDDAAARGVLIDTCRTWVRSIRELLDPTPRVPMRGAKCPLCLSAWQRSEDLTGGLAWLPTLVASHGDGWAQVECEACGGSWGDGELLDLRAAMARDESLRHRISG